MIDLQKRMSAKERKAGDFQVKGWLTRIALIFSAAGNRKFTGTQIAHFLITALHYYEQAKNAGTEPEIPGQALLISEVSE